jgi:senataxin
MVFSSTEKWARRVAVPTAAMEDFCRDAMDFAEALFDEHNIIASIFREASPDADQSLTTSGSSKESIRRILEVPCHNVNGLTMMIRLRDAYLISIITRLLTKLLRCLGEYDLEIDDFASKFIKDACKLEYEAGFKKTNLTNQQKAELRRTLEEHQGIEILEVPPTVKKQSTIDSWSRSADGQKNLQQAVDYSDTSSPTVKKQSTIDSWSKSAGGQRYEPTLPPKTHGLQPTLAERQKAALQLKASTMSTQERDRLFLQNRRKAEEEKKRLNAEAVAKLKANSRSTALVRGEGSGIKDIGGVAGKDHAPVRSEIMVGSSDEESDDEDEDETNALVKTRKETSKRVKEYEESRRRAMQKMQQGPVRKTKTQRSAKDLRARVEPNMDRLYIEILNWDIFHQGDQPPSNNECRKIADKFLDLDLYKVTFGPLLISEVWRSLVAAKDENTFKPVEIKVLNRLSVDKFMEVSTSMPMAFNKELKMAERDIVLLSRSPDPLNNKQEPHCLARVDRTTRKKETLEITYRVSRDLNPAFLQCLAPNGKIYVVKIADMTTTQREFAALSSLDYYDLCNEVLQAEPSPIQRYSEEKISQMASKYTLNKGQAQAILSAHDNDGFTLIQG